MPSGRNDEHRRAEGAGPDAAADPEVIVDLGAAEGIRQRLRRLSHPSHFPDPVPCPRCGGPGALDMIDLAADVREQECDSCGHRWKVQIRP